MQYKPTELTECQCVPYVPDPQNCKRAADILAMNKRIADLERQMTTLAFGRADLRDAAKAPTAPTELPWDKNHPRWKLRGGRTAVSLRRFDSPVSSARCYDSHGCERLTTWQAWDCQAYLEDLEITDAEARRIIAEAQAKAPKEPAVILNAPGCGDDN